MSEKDRLNIVSILDSIDKISQYSNPFKNADEFYKHQMEFDAAMMNFIIIGEMVARLSDEFLNTYNHLDWFKIRGFRNIVAHDYFGIDAEEVWQIIKTHIPILEKELNNILDKK